MIGASEPRWRKSSYSGGGGEDCVEVASLVARRMIAVRDSKNSNGAQVHLSPEQWGKLIKQITHDDPVLDVRAQDSV